MANIASVLKDEIARIARKEIRSETEALKKASARYRGEIAELKRQIASLSKQLGRAKAKDKPAVESEGEGGKFRFRADGLKGHRQRLGVSAKDFATLLGVSVQTLANWEAGKTKPRASQLASIAAVRKLGRREASQQIAATRESAAPAA